MVKLFIEIDGSPERVMELRAGPHRVGRAQDNDIVLLHPSVSSQHGVLEICDEGLKVHDLGSTNGTDLDGQPVLEAYAQSGQVVSFGSVHCRVEGVVPKVTIPKWEEEPPPPLPPGVKPCANHPGLGASFKCDHCHRTFCGACIHLMRRQGGVLHKMCPICSHHVVPIEGMNTEGGSGIFSGLLKKMIPKSGTMFLHGRRRRRRRR